MLDGLDEIDWAGLEHAHGTAEDVPDVLRALASGDEDEADEAFEEFVGSLFHQGDVYPATVPAVPFLLELASAARHQRTEILATVGMLADPQHAWGAEADEAPRGGAGPGGSAGAAAHRSRSTDPGGRGVRGGAVR